MMKFDFNRRTKIVSTLGPATDTPEIIERLIRAGTNVVRLNLSHGSFSQHARHIKVVQKLNRSTGNYTAILIDLPGPKYRIGRLMGGEVLLKKGQIVNLTTRDMEGTSSILPINLPELPQDVRKGDTLLLADGLLVLKVVKTSGTEILCRVITGGTLETGKGLVVPGRHVSAPFITPITRAAILFAIRQKPDFLALSFVSSADDILKVKTILQENGVNIPLISKIERVEAVKNLESILEASDAIMVARGDLGVEIPMEKVPLIQKEIIRRCNHAGKPVITATEMLESMVNASRPTRAETTDVANAIFDGTDAVMLSAETAIGKYPIAAVSMMARIAREVEKKLPYERILTERGNWIKPETDELISYNACHTAYSLKAAAIVAYTQSGSTARRVSHFRPKTPVLAINPNNKICGSLVLCWGVFPVRGKKLSNISDTFDTAASLCRQLKLAKPGKLIVITGGIPFGQAGSTNMLKVEKIS